MGTLKEVMDIPNQVIDAADKVVETGMKEAFDVHLTLFGRRLGVRVEVSLLHKDPKAPQ